MVLHGLTCSYSDEIRYEFGNKAILELMPGKINFCDETVSKLFNNLITFVLLIRILLLILTSNSWVNFDSIDLAIYYYNPN